jgi:hypothetical protein
MWAVGVSWLRFPSLRWFSALSLLLPFTSVYLWWGTFRELFSWRNVAIPELLTVLTAIVWLWLFLGLKEKGVLDTHILKHVHEV